MSRPLRVLLLCDRLDVSGGVERFVCALANELAGQGLEVAVGSVDTPRSAVRYPLVDAVRVVTGTGTAAPEASAPSSRLARAWRLLRAQWRIGRSLSRLIRRESPDVVVLNGLTTACSVLLLDRRFSSRTVCCDHNHFGARSRLWQRLRAGLYPKVAAVVSLTEADAPRFRALNPRTRVIPNTSALQAQAPSAPAQPIVLAVGRHQVQKGFDLLLPAWVEVLKRLPGARLRIVGDGPLRAEHERLAQQLGVAAQVEFLAPRAQIESLYREAAVFVLPSRYEGMPLALLEAQALGVPAVAFDCPTGPAEILTPETGRLVPAGDVPALAEALVALLSASVDERAAMGRAAIARSRTRFSPELHVQRWLQLVREVGLRQAYGVPGTRAT
jgi:glycosyltransferase involved in cell wall biosynthesis